MDIQKEFINYDRLFFNSILGEIYKVDWSNKLRSSAGVCYYNPPVIYISRQLHDYLTETAVRETLLHEMIHAYLFLTYADSIRDSHGKKFIAMMNNINRATGMNITIKHNYINEIKTIRNNKKRNCNICGFTISIGIKQFNYYEKIHNTLCEGALKYRNVITSLDITKFNLPMNVKQTLIDHISSIKRLKNHSIVIDVLINNITIPLQCDKCNYYLNQNKSDMDLHKYSCNGCFLPRFNNLQQFNLAKAIKTTSIDELFNQYWKLLSSNIVKNEEEYFRAYCLQLKHQKNKCLLNKQYGTTKM